MKTMRTIIAMFLICVVAVSASAQVKTTAYGWQYNDNRNLRFTDGESKTVVTVLGSASFGGDYEAYGADVEIRRQHNYYSLGGAVGSEHSSEYGFANHAHLLAGVNTQANKTIVLGVDGYVGYGQAHINTMFDNGAGYTSPEQTSTWKPYAGASVRADIALSKSVTLSLRGGYKHTFVQTSDQGATPSGTWTISEQKTDADRFFAQAGLSFRFGGKSQISGDNCWRILPFGGWSNKGVFGGVEASHFTRTSAKGGVQLGIGTQWTAGDDPLNEIYLKGGYTILPQGAKSPFTFDLALSIGLGEYERENTESSTKADNGYTLSENSNHATFMVDAKIHAGINYHIGSVTLGAHGFFGGYTGVGKSYIDNSDMQYDGTKGKTADVLYGAYLNVGVAF